MAGLLSIAAGGAEEAYTIDQSCRFDRQDSCKMDWTPSSAATDNKKFTMSFWLKRSDLGGNMNLLNPDRGGDGANEAQFGFVSADTLRIYDSGGNRLHLLTYKLFRDVAAWYHIFVAVDTTQATSTNRAKIYINGEQITSFDGSYAVQYPALNATLGWGVNGNLMRLGNAAYGSGSQYYDGYIAEFYYIDGTAYTPSDFAETNSTTGQWIPIDASGLTFGNNGFYLKFEDAADLGNDSSGNGNDFTTTLLTATDQVLDSPTNNFCTLNPLMRSGYQGYSGQYSVFSEANLTINGYPNAYRIYEATTAMSSGKWYAEYRPGDTNTKFGVSGMDETASNMGEYWQDTTSAQTMLNNNNGNKILDGTPTSYTGSGAAVGDVTGIAVDLDAGTPTIQFYINNSAKGTIDLSSRCQTATGLVFSGVVYENDPESWNFGADSSFGDLETPQGNSDANGIGDFYYTPPSGYLALCSSNLADPSIKLPGDHFNTHLYTGDGSTNNPQTGIGFKPDLVWIKNRATTYPHIWVDAVRGAGYVLESDNTNAEENRINSVSSFDTDGFTVKNDSYTNAGSAFASWNWLGNGVSGGTLNEVGTLDSQVNANTTSGFSICEYNGNETSGATFGHGLSEAPTLVIVKKVADAGSHWVTGFSAGTTGLPLLTNTGFKRPLELDDTDIQIGYDDAGYFNSVNPSATVVTLGNYGDTNKGTGMVAYCFHSVVDYSKISFYIGNGNVDGAFVYTGFRPAWAMIKCYNTAGNSWHILDDKRSPDNDADLFLFANLTNADTASSPGVDFVSNGLKMRANAGGWNSSSSQYICVAFAASPFKYSNAR